MARHATQPEAFVAFRPVLHYRLASFRAGLERMGFRTLDRPSKAPGPGDLLIIWNRKPAEAALISHYERAGAKILVAENGYIGKDEEGGKLFAMARDHHNGAGSWESGGAERWAGFGLEVLPWRERGSHVLVLPQRGIGEPGVAMHPAWTGHAIRTLGRATKREVRLRRHPGDTKAEPYADLAGAWAAVTWGSSAAIKALVAGIPVFHELPSWIGAGAARLGLGEIEKPFLGDRLPMLERLAWAQWRIGEIERGEAFEWLLR